MSVFDCELLAIIGVLAISQGVLVYRCAELEAAASERRKND